MHVCVVNWFKMHYKTDLGSKNEDLGPKSKIRQPKQHFVLILQILLNCDEQAKLLECQLIGKQWQIMHVIVVS